MPHTATIEAKAEGVYAIKGDLRLDTAAGLSTEAARLLVGHGGVTLDFSGITSADSASIAFILECMRKVRAAGGDLRVRGLTAQIEHIANACRMRHLLPLA